eukprot:1002250_1
MVRSVRTSKTIELLKTMGIITKIIGVVCVAYTIYIMILFSAFNLDLKRDIFLFKYVPSINDGYDKPFDVMGLCHMLFWIVVWGVHHSLFARGWMGAIVANVMPSKLERSLYIFVSSMLLDCMLYDKQIYFGGGIIWDIQWWNECNFFVRNSLAFVGCGYFGVAFLELGGLNLLGIPQSFEWNTKKTTDRNNVASTRLQHTELVTTGRYRLVRHPLQTGTLFLLWCSPFMTLQKLLCNLALTTYIIIGINLEETDCVHMFGDKYIKYQRKTPQLIPFLDFCPFHTK